MMEEIARVLLLLIQMPKVEDKDTDGENHTEIVVNEDKGSDVGQVIYLSFYYGFFIIIFHLTLFE